MEQRPYRAAIFGATFLGIGAALCLEPSVILESGERLGAEFAGNHKVCLPKILRPRSTPGKRFAQALLEQGLVDEVGQVHPAPMVPALERLLQGSGASLFLRARILRVERTANAYRLLVCRNRKPEILVAHALVDTTVFGLSHPGYAAGPMQKSLNVLVYNPDAHALPGLFYNPMNGLYTYAHIAPPTAGRREALASLFALESHFRKHNLMIADIAPDFAYAMRPFARRMAKNWLWAPSTAHANPVEAFDEGCRIAQRLSNGTMRFVNSGRR